MRTPSSLPVLVLSALFAVPASAAAAPTLITPDATSIAANRPLFSWTAPAGETVAAVAVAKLPNQTPEGELYSENLVDFGVPAEGATTYQDSYMLAAGNYWWNVRWESENPYASTYSAPLAFTIPAKVKVSSIKVTQYGYNVTDSATVVFNANTRTATTTCTLHNGRRLVTRKSKATDYVTLGRKSTTYLDLPVARSLAGKRLKVTCTVKAGKASHSLVRYIVGKR